MTADHAAAAPAVLSAIDEQRFGVRVARAPDVRASAVPDVLSFCRGAGVEMLVARCPTDDLDAVHALEDAGARLMDTLVYYERSITRGDGALPVAPAVRTATASDAEAVGNVARAAFRGYGGHYHADPRLDPARADDGYQDWAFRSCAVRGVADHVLVVTAGEQIAGFLTLRRNSPEEQEIVLNAVHPDHQRRGHYRALVDAALCHASCEGASRLIVSTQLTNEAVQRAWVAAGFLPRSSLYTFHLWFDAP